MITFNNIVERFRVFADAHFFVKSFSFGSPDDVDLSKFTNFPLMHLVYTGATYDAGTKTYNLEVYILDVPADKEQKTDRQKEVVSDAEQCAEDIIADIKNGGNIFLFAQDYEVVNATTTPLEEETKNVLSGVLLDLSVAIPYEWDACNAPIDGVSPEGGDEVAYARRGILRMLTENGVTDVLSVRTIKVTNGTLTDNGDGVVTLDTGGATQLDDLDDVTISGFPAAQFLQYNAISGQWENETLYLSTLADTKGTPAEGKYLKYTGGFWQPADVAATLGQLTDVDTSSQSAGYVLMYTGSTWAASLVPILNGTNITRSYVNGFAKLDLNDNITLTAITADTLKATGDLVVQIDSDNNGANNSLIVKDGANNEVFRISEAGVVTINEEYSLPAADGNPNQLLKTDGAGTLSFGANLQDLDNVSTLTPSGNQVLTWSSASGEWQPAALPSPPPTVDELNDLSDVTITTPAANQILRYSGSVWQNEDLTQYHDRYQSDAATLRSGATATTEIYYSAIADGDGYAESASSDTPATGYDIRRKLYYSEAGFADPDTGTWVQFADIPDDTTFASAKATLLAYLKERTGGTVPISLKMTWEEVAEAPAFTGLLNESYGSGAAAAYSVRRLNGNYTGAAIEVERSSDNTTQDIGFDVDGNLDESALTTFCTGTVCKVRSWFDQSGNGNDAVQTTHANQPTIYTGGAIVKENGRVAVQFDGSDDKLINTSPSGFSGKSQSAFLIAQTFDSSASNLDFYFGLGDASSPAGTLRSITQEPYLRFSSTVQDYNSHHVQNAQELFSLVCSSTVSTIDDYDLYKNGSLLTPDSLSGGTVNDVSTGILSIGTNTYQNLALNGQVQELILYNSDKSTDRTSIESNIGDYFTQNTPLLDTYTGAAAAYSLRKLRTAYSGSAIRVRRASDNTEQDIGWNVFGELDTVSLASFCSGTNGFVKTWYDQSGNANDATQTNTAKQPKIYDSSTGVVTDSNGNKIAFFDTGSIFENIATFNTSPHTAFAVTQGTGVRTQLYGFGSNNAYLHYSLEHWNGRALQTYLGDGATFTAYASTATWNTNTHLITSIYNGTDTSLYIDTSLDNTNSETKTSSAALSINSRGSRPMYLAELILYTADKSSDRTGIESNLNTFYTL